MNQFEHAPKGTITDKQIATLTSLIARHGKPLYLAVKFAEGIPQDVTIERMSKFQAAQVIGRLIAIEQGGRR